MRLLDLAEKLNGVVEGNGDLEITGVSGLREAAEGHLSFLSSRKYLYQARSSRASAILVAEDFEEEIPAALIRVENPDQAFQMMAIAFAPDPVAFTPGVHAAATIAADGEIGEGVHIGPNVIVESGATIGARSVLIGNTYIGHRVTIGEDALIYPQVSIRENCIIGDRFIANSGVVIGSEGFGYTADENGVRTKVPQIGNVEIGHDVELGANVSVDRARFGATRLGNGVKVDNLVQIAHNVVLGDNSVLVAQVGVAGSSIVGSGVILAGQCGITGHTMIGDGAIVSAMTGVTKDVEPGAIVMGFPAQPVDKFRKQQAHVARLPKLKEKVELMEQRIERLEAE